MEDDHDIYLPTLCEECMYSETCMELKPCKNFVPTKGTNFVIEETPNYNETVSPEGYIHLKSRYQEDI